MTRLVVLSAALLTACATASGVRAIGPDTYSVHRGSYAPTASLMDVKTEAYKDASDFCAARGQVFQATGSTDIPRAFAQFPETEVQFRCVAKPQI